MQGAAIAETVVDRCLNGTCVMYTLRIVSGRQFSIWFAAKAQSLGRITFFSL